MPFIAECPVHGPIAQGDFSENAHLRYGARHVIIDAEGRLACFEKIITHPIDTRQKAPYIPGIAPDQRAVVWEHPVTGQVRYPGRSDAVMPDRYAKAGYQRRELTSLREVEKFEKQKGVRSEAAHYDRGSGRGFDDIA